MALPPRRRRPLGKGRSSLPVDATTVHGLLWLAMRWESLVFKATGRRLRVVERPILQIKPPYIRTFQRFAAYLKREGIAADRYISLLLARFEDRTPYTKQLGSRFYNAIVAEQATRRQRMFGDQPDPRAEAYLVTRPTDPADAPSRLAVDVARLVVYRQQYHWFEWGRFWLFFAGEFTGAFLFLCPEYHAPGVPDLLSEQQRQEWVALERDERRQQRARQHYRLFRRRVGSLQCQTIQTANLETIAQLIQGGPRSPQHLSA